MAVAEDAVEFDFGEEPAETESKPACVAVELLPPNGDERAADDAEEKPPPAADLPKQGMLKLICQNCHANGLIPWGNLHRLLCCSGCRTWYRVAPGGQMLTVQAPAQAGRGTLRAYLADGQQRTLPVPTEPPIQSRWWESYRGGDIIGFFILVLGRRSVALATLLLLLGGGTYRIAQFQANKPRPLPDGLEARARLFAEAWLGGDTQILVRLTDPEVDRRLRRWLADNPAPIRAEQFKRRHASFEARILNQDDRSARVEVKVTFLDRAAPTIIDGSWTVRGSTWYFVPPTPVSHTAHAQARN